MFAIRSGELVQPVVDLLDAKTQHAETANGHALAHASYDLEETTSSRGAYARCAWCFRAGPRPTAIGYDPIVTWAVSWTDCSPSVTVTFTR
jgi:hypothetical protein